MKSVRRKINEECTAATWIDHFWNEMFWNDQF